MSRNALALHPSTDIVISKIAKIMRTEPRPCALAFRILNSPESPQLFIFLPLLSTNMLASPFGIQRQRRPSLPVPALAVRDNFHKLDTIFHDSHDLSMVLSHVISHLDPIDDAVADH